MHGKVKELYISTKDKKRQNVDHIEIDFQGIHNDKFYSKGKERSILISSIDSYILANKNAIELEFGSLGENILLDINPYHLKAGAKVYIGEVVLEITQNCTICNSLSKVSPNLPFLLKEDRGIFARTYKEGKIYKNDSVSFKE